MVLYTKVIFSVHKTIFLFLFRAFAYAKGSGSGVLDVYMLKDRCCLTKYNYQYGDYSDYRQDVQNDFKGDIDKSMFCF